MPSFFKRVFSRVLAFRPNRRLLKPIGYSTLFSVFFSIFLVLSLPLDRFIPNAEGLLSKATERKVRIGDLSTSITGGFVLSDVEIGTGAKEAKEEEADPDSKSGKKEKKAPPVGYQIEELDVDIGLLSMLLFHELNLDVEVSALDGTLHISYKGPLPESMRSASEETSTATQDALPVNARIKKAAAPEPGAEKAPEDDAEEADETPVSLDVGFDEINLTQVHDLKDLLPVPIAGTLNLDMTLESDTSSFAEANGKIDFALSDLMLSKKGYEATLMGSSLKVPPILIESMSGTIEFEKGVGKVTKFEVTSKDCALTLQGSITLNDSLSKSQNDLYITFNLLGGYLKKSAAIKTLLASADTFSREMKNAHRADGSYGFRYHGMFGKGRFTPAKEFKPTPKESGKNAKDKRKPKRKRRKPAQRSANQPKPPPMTGGLPVTPPPPPPPVQPVVSEPPPATPMEPPTIETREQIRSRFGQEEPQVTQPEEEVSPSENTDPISSHRSSRARRAEAAAEEEAPPEQEEVSEEEPESPPEEEQEAPAEEEAPQDDGEGAQNEEPQEDQQEEVEAPEPQEEE